MVAVIQKENDEPALMGLSLGMAKEFPQVRFGLSIPHRTMRARFDIQKPCFNPLQLRDVLGQSLRQERFPDTGLAIEEKTFPWTELVLGH